MSLLRKKLAAGAAVMALGGFLAACDTDDDAAEDMEVVEEGEETEGEDAVTAASITDDADQVVASLSTDGNWLTAIIADVAIDDDVTVAGTFHDGDDEAEAEYRKLALYAQDEDRNVTDEYTLAVGTMTVESPNFRIQEGTLDGDVYVDAEGFELLNSTVTGDVTFASQELMDAALMDEGTVEGEVTVEE
ncbi:polymer-forming cytoskeletal protein [Alkalibacterium sp. f15]|uniref:polymer-forming cytoskeletal protein n=1 Tax=Alkalibacterium sp. f15 TaxID=3414029 RepID=UPI003BF89BD3